MVKLGKQVVGALREKQRQPLPPISLSTRPGKSRLGSIVEVALEVNRLRDRRCQS
jgi:hypothetical protein